MKKIPLTQGKVALVDDEDYDRVSRHKWCIDKRGHTSYAILSSKHKGGHATRRMHSYIIGDIEGMMIDHINSNGLDNRKVNLRHCTRSQNMANQRSRVDTSSVYKGIWWRKDNNKWRVRIVKDGVKHNLGNFICEIEAAKAYDKAAREHFGEFARLNFPEREAV